jgi:Tfp pilus assembly protein PilO
MRRDFTVRKRVIVVALAVLVLADISLAVYSWQLASGPQSPREELAAQAKLRDLLKKSIDNAQKIRDSIPAIQKDCDQFEKSLFPASSGYSAVISELGDTARKSGIQIEELTHKQAEISNRGMTEVAVDATVNGNYKNVIGFLNGLQRSPNHYAVDSLTLGSEANQASANVIKVALHLRTYFRTAA